MSFDSLPHSRSPSEFNGSLGTPSSDSRVPRNDDYTAPDEAPESSTRSCLVPRKIRIWLSNGLSGDTTYSPVKCHPTYYVLKQSQHQQHQHLLWIQILIVEAIKSAIRDCQSYWHRDRSHYFDSFSLSPILPLRLNFAHLHRMTCHLHKELELRVYDDASPFGRH